MLRGALLVNKEVGLSSYDVIRIIKRKLKSSGIFDSYSSDDSFSRRRFKIGHSGSLDPISNGVLIILFNEATKISSFLVGYEKEYIGVIRLGIQTDTDDITGKIIAKKKVPKFRTHDIIDALKKFQGQVDQFVPLYSAVKIEGRPSYLKARKNESVTLKKRLVECYQLELLDYFKEILLIKAVVGRGFYLRSLARDIGNELGCGGTLGGLTRVRIGKWTVEDCLQVWELDYENIKNNLISIRDALYNFKEYFYDKPAISDFKIGHRLFCPDTEVSGYCKVISNDEKTLIIGEKEKNYIKFVRTIYDDR